MDWSLTLRAAMKRRIDAGESLHAMAVSCGLSRTSVYEFYHGRRGLTFEAGATLATFLGFRLSPPRIKVVSPEHPE